MAGAGYKTFNTGDVLTASDVMTYLMQQTVMVFDDAAARTSALGANVAEGMFSYLKDTNLTYRYDGSSWLSDAGTTSPLTTKGDVWGYSTTDTRIPVGADGTVLTADSNESLGVKWAAVAAGGFVGCSVSRQSGTQSISNATTTAVTFTNEDIDTDGFFDSATSSSRIVIPTGKAGKYLLTGSLVFASDVTTALYIRFYLNGGNITSAATQAGSIRVPGATDLLSSSVVASAVATDYFEMMVYQNSGGSSRNLSGAQFTATYLGA